MITEEEKKIIKRLKDDIALVTFNDNLNYGIGNLYVNINDLKIILNLISKLQSDIEIKDKVIDLMAEKLVEDSDVFNYQHSMTEEKWKEYFYKQVEKVGGEDE